MSERDYKTRNGRTPLLMPGTIACDSAAVSPPRLVGYRSLDLFCPDCKTIATIDLAKVDRHPGCVAGIIRVVAQVPPTVAGCRCLSRDCSGCGVISDR